MTKVQKNQTRNWTQELPIDLAVKARQELMLTGIKY